MRINLLPQETVLLANRRSQIELLGRVALVVFIICSVLTSVTLTARILQNVKLTEVNNQIKEAEGNLDKIKDKEAYLLILKNRLGTVATVKADSKKAALFNLIVGLTPSEMNVSSTAINNNGEMEISASTKSVENFSQLVADLNSKEKNESLVTRTELLTLSSGNDGSYRFTLKVVPK